MVGEAEISNLEPHQLQNHSPQTRRSSGGGVSLDNFPIGSVVEVRTDEEGFKFVYFTATVIPADSSSKSPKKSGRKKSFKRSGGKDKSTCLHVEYHNLLANDNGLDRLKESVDISNVRPVPPVQEVAKGFELGDAVDAFYKDGWWQGAVLKVLDGGDRFLVKFEDPPDFLECGNEDLRFHWDWVNGSWVRPQKQTMTGLMFDVGRKVEVSFDREDSQDAWFPATIHEDLGNGVFRVEYTDKRGEAVKTTVDSNHVRPCPPLLKDTNFVLLEKVDAYFDYCWWSGVITKELENNTYIVYFKPMKLDREINQLKLRPHMDWKDGKWFTSSQETSIQSSDGVHGHHISGNSSASVETAPVKNSVGGKTPISLISTKGHTEQSTPDNQQLSYITPSLKKRKQNLTGSGSTHSQPPKKIKEGNVAGTKPQDRKDGYGQTKEVLISFQSPESVSNTNTSAMQTTEDQPSFDHSLDQTFRKQRNLRQKQNSSELTTPTSSSMKNSIPTMFASGSLDIRGEVAGSAENFVEEHANEDLEVPIIIGLPCFEVGSPGLSGGRKSQNFKIKEVASIVNDKGHPLIDPVQKVKDTNQPGTQSGERRKRGRPKRTVLESPQTPVPGNAQNGDAGLGDLRKKDDLPRNPQAEVTGTEAMLSDPKKNEGNKEKVADGLDYPKYRRVRTMKRTSPSVHKENGAKESGELGDNLLSVKKGRKMTDVQVQDSPNASMEVDPTAHVQGTELDNEPLSRWIVELNSPPLTESSRRSPDGTADDCQANSGVEAMVGNGTQLGSPAAILVDKDVAETSTTPSLPFVKNVSVWKTVESMEVFQKIPQNPHFRPLEQVEESSYREGLALGLMVSFASLVDTASKLRASDPKDTVDEMLETLANLNNHGFDLAVIQDRISEFLEVKEKEDKLVCEVRELNDQIVERNHDSTRIEEEMQEINEQIRRLQEKHALIKSAKEKTADEVANLQRQLENTQESIENVRRNFKGWVSVIAP